MFYLANNCRRSEIKVLPKNWKTTTTTKKPWQIYYRFYDPVHPDANPLQAIRDMNKFTDVDQRRAYTVKQIEWLKDFLDKRDYNPFTGYFKELMEPEQIDYEILPGTPLLAALQMAYEKKAASETTKTDLRSVLKYTTVAVKNIHMDVIPVKDIKRRHIKLLLEQIGRVKLSTVVNKNTGKKGTWSANTQNYYRSHLMMLFDELVEWQAIEHNPIDAKLKKAKHVVKKRAVLTKQQRKAIDDYLRKDHYTLWRFMRIFFESGAREIELLQVKREDVDLEAQTVMYTVKKGGYRQETRVITNSSLNLWQQACVGAKKGQYIFSDDLAPGDKFFTRDRLTKTWQRIVKNHEDEHGNKVFGDFVADFYSLKHSHSTELKRKIGAKLTARHNQHTEAILNSAYDVEGRDDEQEILKGITVEFAQ